MGPIFQPSDCRWAAAWLAFGLTVFGGLAFAVGWAVGVAF